MELQSLEEKTQLMTGQQSHDAAANGVPPAADNDAAAAEDFLCGVALSVYQNSGGADTNWEAWENKRSMFMPTIAVRM